MGLFPRRPTPENPKKHRASSNHHHSTSSEAKKQVMYRELAFWTVSFYHLPELIFTSCCFCSESQHSDKHSGLSALPTSQTAVSWRIQPVFRHVKLWRTSISRVRGQLWSSEAAKGKGSRSWWEPPQGTAPPHAALHAKWPRQMECGGRLWVYLLTTRYGVAILKCGVLGWTCYYVSQLFLCWS